MSRSKFNGSYRFVCSDNKAAVMKAWFNNQLPEQDMEVMMHPDNQITSTVVFTDKGMKASVNFSMKPDYNMDYELNFNEEKSFPPPLEGKVIVTEGKDPASFHEVMTFKDGTSYTMDSHFSSQGYTAKSTGSNGYIGNAYFERINASIEGFFVLESHENMDKMIMEDAGISASAANALLASGAVHITESNGVYTLTDYMGDSGSKVTHFKMGEEFDYEDATIGVKGKALVTMTGPGSLTYVMKDSSGKSSVWEGHATPDQMIWKVTKPLNTIKATITYTRKANILGRWKMTAMDNALSLMKSLSMPDSMIATALEERPVSCHEYIGAGRFKTNSGSSMFTEDVMWKSGEEFSLTIQGFAIHEVMTLTKTGIVGTIKMGGKTMAIKSTVGKTFNVIEEEVVGEPGTKATYILTRV